MKGNALIHYLRFSIGLDKPHTQTTARERDTIAKYAKGCRKCVEIGVYEGINTVTIAKAIMDIENSQLFAIDPFFKGRLGVCYHEKIAKRLAKRNGVYDRIEWLPFFSFDAVDKVPGNVDFIFVDGDHSLEGISRDWQDWGPKLSTNGILALHDTAIPEHDASVSTLGSYKFFNEVIVSDPGFELLETVDSLNILRKR